MDENGKVAPAGMPCHPPHWDDTPLTSISHEESSTSTAKKAVGLGRPPPGFVHPK